MGRGKPGSHSAYTAAVSRQAKHTGTCGSSSSREDTSRCYEPHPATKEVKEAFRRHKQKKAKQEDREATTKQNEEEGGAQWEHNDTDRLGGKRKTKRRNTKKNRKSRRR
jgi:hypothetical protein